MNPEWNRFLHARNIETNPATPCDHNAGINSNTLCAIVPPGVLAVSGSDAGGFLQGQASCDIELIRAQKSGLGAFCNPQGRVITTFRILALEHEFLLILPQPLLAPLQKRLQIYVLRSDVKLEDVSAAWCSLGIYGESLAPQLAQQGLSPLSESPQPGVTGQPLCIAIEDRAQRYLILSSPDAAPKLWENLAAAGFAEAGPGCWHERDILNGIPETGPETSGEFVPQMLNLDVLGGISFNKGCYTGQEVVARMHYLGKLKRRMYLGSSMANLPAPGTPIFDANSDRQQSVGQILQATPAKPAGCRFLTVLQIASTNGDLRIGSAAGEPLELQNLPYTFDQTGASGGD